MSQQPYQLYPGQPQYGPPPTQYPAGAPQPQYGQQPAGDGVVEEFDSVAPPVGGETIKMHQLTGRLVLFRPTSAPGMKKGYNGGPEKMGMTVEAIIMDGPPVPGMVDGRNGQVTKPFAAGPKNPPFFVAVIHIQHDLLLQQLGPLWENHGFTLNRIELGQATGTNSPPFKLAMPTDQDKALARSIIGPRIAEGFNRIKAASAPEPEQQYVPATPPPVQQAPAQPPYQQPAQAPYPYQGPPAQQYPPQGPPAAPWGHPPAGPPAQQNPWGGQ